MDNRKKFFWKIFYGYRHDRRFLFLEIENKKSGRRDCRDGRIFLDPNQFTFSHLVLESQ